MDEKQTNWKSQAMLFLISQCITLFGSTLVQMAIVWYVTIQTSSGVWVAAFTVCSYLPQFLISFVAGVWADRHSRKKLIIGADSLIALVTFLMVLVIPHITDKTVVLGGLLVMSVIRSFGAGIQTPAVNAVIPQLVPEDQIMRFNGINATMQSVVQFAAPAAAGVLLTINTLSSTLIIDTATAIVGIGLLSAVIIPKQAIQSKGTSVFIDMKIGILAVQGAFIEHRKIMEKLGAECVEIRQKKDLDGIEGIILPGGESTVQGKLLNKLDIFTELKQKIENGLPVLATCAGLILLAQNIENDNVTHLATLPVTVRRNAYGRQLGSFVTNSNVGCVDNFPLVFIRAPYITDVSPDVEILTCVDSNIVGVKYRNQIGLAFHPEMTNDTRIHELFCREVEMASAGI